MTEEVNAVETAQAEVQTDSAPVEQTPVEETQAVSEDVNTPEVESAEGHSQPGPVPYDRFSKAISEKNELKPKAEAAQKFEEETGMPIEDFLVQYRTKPLDSNGEAKVDAPKDMDQAKFDQMAAQAVEEKYGSLLDELFVLKNRLETRDGIASLPEDARNPEVESTLKSYLEKNPSLALTNEGLQTAYYAVKGLMATQQQQQVTENKQTRANEIEVEKEVAFVENSKESGEIPKETNLDKLANLSTEEYAKLPQEVREQLLQNL